MTKLYGVSCCHHLCHHCCCQLLLCWYNNIFLCTHNYIVWSNDENRTINNNNLCHFPSPSSAVVDCYIWLCWYVQRNDNNGVVFSSMMMSIYLLDLLSCLCPSPSVPLRIISTHLSQVYTYNCVMMLYVLYDGVICVPRSNNHSWWCHYQYCMLGAAMNNVFSDGNHKNDNTTNTTFSSLSDAAAYVIFPWVQHKYSP